MPTNRPLAELQPEAMRAMISWLSSPSPITKQTIKETAATERLRRSAPGSCQMSKAATKRCYIYYRSRRNGVPDSMENSGRLSNSTMGTPGRIYETTPLRQERLPGFSGENAAASLLLNFYLDMIPLALYLHQSRVRNRV